MAGKNRVSELNWRFQSDFGGKELILIPVNNLLTWCDQSCQRIGGPVQWPVSASWPIALIAWLLEPVLSRSRLGELLTGRKAWQV